MLQKVTMVIKVDLSCKKCCKKIKKILCKIPQIQNQIYDEKVNTVNIIVVSCSPEKIKKIIYCKRHCRQRHQRHRRHHCHQRHQRHRRDHRRQRHRQRCHHVVRNVIKDVGKAHVATAVEGHHHHVIWNVIKEVGEAHATTAMEGHRRRHHHVVWNVIKDVEEAHVTTAVNCHRRHHVLWNVIKDVGEAHVTTAREESSSDLRVFSTTAMAEEKVTMVIKVDLSCKKCCKKIKKILCEIPQIRNQIYDEKANTVNITVVCCSPEKIKKIIYCKGGDSVQCIDIKTPPPPPPPTPTMTSTPPPPPTSMPPPPPTSTPPLPPPPTPSCCTECRKGCGGGPCCYCCGRPPPPYCMECYKGSWGCPCYHCYGRSPPQPPCCMECYKGCRGGPCYHCCELPPPPPCFME
ncbi:uncharacterized protein LOC131180100 [Hevea brasiliensis]|nr:uncharacterized protein LOC131180100 [Hevea brasiliensis]